MKQNTTQPSERQAPIRAMLDKAQGRVRMHMPGHKGQTPAGWDAFGYDMTEIDTTGDLFAPDGAMAEAARLAAGAAGASCTLPLSGGSTAGVLAMLLATASAGGEVIVARNCHHSVLSACALAHAEPVFVYPRHVDGWAYIAPEDVTAAIAAHPHAQAVVVTRPDYLGVCVELADIARAAHDTGMRLLVDEAHGTHLNWTASGQPAGAGACGADAWVQSAHKTLPALTGAAWLHLAGVMDAERVRGILRMVHTSSPSFPILASLDAARAWMDAKGGAALVELHARVADFWRRLREAQPELANAHDRLSGVAGQAFDPARVVIEAANLGYTGDQVAAHLASQGIDIEMADARCVVLIPSVADPPDALACATEALSRLSIRPPLHNAQTSLPAAERVMPLWQAALSPSEPVPLAQAVGRVAAVSAGAYPPGIPWVVPGERISAQAIGALSGAAHTFGISGGGIRCVQNTEHKG